MKRFVQSFPFLMVMGVCMHVACGDADNGTDTTGVGPVGAQGTGYSPACNLDRRDGYCNALGQNPESCECFDCVDTAMCKGKCVQDGTCSAEEDCTCVDCGGTGDCLPPDPDTTMDAGPAPASTTADTSASTSDASTAETTAASTSGGMGGMGGQGGS